MKKELMAVKVVVGLKNSKIVENIESVYRLIRDTYGKDTTRKVHVMLAESLHKCAKRSGVTKAFLIVMYDQLLDLYHLAVAGITVPDSSKDWKTALVAG